MEYATRAGAGTARYYGETEELLGKYAWYVQNGNDRTWPVGSKKPNDLGLFDVHGNVWGWCQERLLCYPKGGAGSGPLEDKKDDLAIPPTASRVLRGGSFHYPASFVRSASRDGVVATYRYGTVGFRPARTFR